VCAEEVKEARAMPNGRATNPSADRWSRWSRSLSPQQELIARMALRDDALTPAFGACARVKAGHDQGAQLKKAVPALFHVRVPRPQLVFPSIEVRLGFVLPAFRKELRGRTVSWKAFVAAPNKGMSG
jgi:hypothetical protein